jgi:hypothetical protein
VSTRVEAPTYDEVVADLLSSGSGLLGEGVCDSIAKVASSSLDAFDLSGNLEFASILEKAAEEASPSEEDKTPPREAKKMPADVLAGFDAKDKKDDKSEKKMPVDVLAEFESKDKKDDKSDSSEKVAMAAVLRQTMIEIQSAFSGEECGLDKRAEVLGRGLIEGHGPGEIFEFLAKMDTEKVAQEPGFNWPGFAGDVARVPLSAAGTGIGIAGDHPAASLGLVGAGALALRSRRRTRDLAPSLSMGESLRRQFSLTPTETLQRSEGALSRSGDKAFREASAAQSRLLAQGNMAAAGRQGAEQMAQMRRIVDVSRSAGIPMDEATRLVSEATTRTGRRTGARALETLGVGPGVVQFGAGKFQTSIPRASLSRWGKIGAGVGAGMVAGKMLFGGKRKRERRPIVIG